MKLSDHSVFPNCFKRLAASAIVMLVVTVGCTSPRIDRELNDLTFGSKYRPENLYTVSQLPQDLRRVAVLPVYVASGSEADAAEINGILLSELRRIGRFEIVEISPGILYSLIGSNRLSTLVGFPENLRSYLQNQIKADGVLQVDLTSYRPYRPFEVGLRSRLFSLDSGEPLWAVDEVLNAGNKTVYTGSRHYSLGAAYNKYPFEDSYAALRSPNRFTAYSALTLFETIPGFSVTPAL